MSLLTLYRRYSNLLCSSDGHIFYFNWWNKQPADEIWFTVFLRSRSFLDHYSKNRLVCFSSLGSLNILRLDALAHPSSHNRKRIYFNGGNNYHPHFALYQNNLLDRKAIDSASASTIPATFATCDSLYGYWRCSFQNLSRRTSSASATG